MFFADARSLFCAFLPRMYVCRLCTVPPPQDWFSNMQNLPKSRLLYNIKGHLFYNTAFAFAVSMVHLLTPQHVIDDLHVSVRPRTTALRGAPFCRMVVLFCSFGLRLAGWTRPNRCRVLPVPLSCSVR